MNNTEHQKVVFEPHGFVRLVDYSGDELSIVNAARVSFANESKWIEDPSGNFYFSTQNDGNANIWERDTEDSNKVLSKSDSGLINYLLKNKHGSPFEHGFMSQWHIRLPIFVMREWVRHRVGFSVNEESGRYTEMRPDFYIPEYIRTQKGKPGAYKFEEVDKVDKEFAQLLIKNNSENSFFRYKEMLEVGIAKEVARMVLPLNLYTEIRWTANARSLMNFLSLRNSEHAMFEIRKYAEALEEIFAREMPNVYESFILNDRVAP